MFFFLFLPLVTVLLLAMSARNFIFKRGWAVVGNFSPFLVLYWEPFDAFMKKKNNVPAIFGQGTKNCLKSKKDAFNPFSSPRLLKYFYAVRCWFTTLFRYRFVDICPLALDCKENQKKYTHQTFWQAPAACGGHQVDTTVGIPTNTSTSFSMFPDLPFSGRSEKCAGSFASIVSWPHSLFFYGTPTHVTCRRGSCFLKNYRQLSAAESCGFTTGSVPNAFRTLQKYHTTAGKLQLNLEGRLLTRFSRR